MLFIGFLESWECYVLPGSRKVSHLPLRYMDPKIVWPCIPSLSWIFGERDQLSVEPLSLPGAQALPLVYVWFPSSLFSENRLLHKAALFLSTQRPAANLPASLADNSSSWSKHTSVLSWFTLVRKKLPRKKKGAIVVCDLWYICMIRYNVEFVSNDYENYVATWKHAHCILLSGKIKMQNFMCIIITTIVTSDFFFFLHRNREHNSGVKVRTELYHVKREFLF